MMDRDTVAQEANNLAMARRDLPRARDLLEMGYAFEARANEATEHADEMQNAYVALTAEIGRALGKFRREIERIESE
jgi:hypothetical protein